MSSRIRGEHDTRWGRWRPTVARNSAASAHAMPHSRRPLKALSWRQAVAFLAAGAVIAVGGVVAVGELAPGPPPSQLPATPRAWLDAYEAAAIDNPSRVCSQLFAPQLAQAYGNAVHGTCSSYFARITSFSVVVRRVLQDGGTAVLELRQTVRRRDWAVVLNRGRDGWQAVDLLAGDLAR
jgi:hypothetical protein